MPNTLPRDRLLADRHNVIMRIVVKVIMAGADEAGDDAFGLLVLESAAAALISELAPPMEVLDYCDRFAANIKARIGRVIPSVIADNE